MNSNSANLFNFAVGVFGFATTIASVALFFRAYLPGAQMKILDELLKETRTIFEIADADGLFPSDAFRKTSLTMLIWYVCLEFAFISSSNIRRMYVIVRRSRAHCFAKGPTTQQRLFKNTSLYSKDLRKA